MKTARAFAPANISLMFAVLPNTDPSETGSIGVGCTLDQGLVAVVSQASKTNILWNNQEIDLPCVFYVVEKLAKSPVRISLTSDLPLGCGFGLSGASALAVAYALNQLFSIKKSNLELAKLAHVAEVVSKSGLGDVVNQYFGGFCLKTESSAHFKVTRLPIVSVPIYYRVFSKILTKSLLTNKKGLDNINKIGTEKITTLAQSVSLLSLSQVLDESFAFCQQSGLLENKEVIETINDIRSSGGHGSMILVGNSVISDTPFPNSQKAHISFEAAHLL